MKRLSRAAWVAAALATAALVVAGLFPIHNNDTFGHLAQGREIAELGYVPAVDHFSFFRDTPQPWRNYEWGSDLITWWIFAAFGAGGLLVLKSVLLAATAVLLLRRAADDERLPALSVLVAAALLLWSIPGARFRLTMRPELFGYSLAALYLVGLGRLTAGALSRRGRILWIAGLTVAHVFWVNLHGSHLLGVLLVLTHLVPVLKLPGPRRDLALVLGGTAVASCVSPFGPAIVIDAIAHVVDPAFRVAVREWAPWSETDPVFYLIALVAQALLLAIAAIPLFRGGEVQRTALTTASALALAAFRSLRFIATFLMLSAPLLAPGLARILRLRVRRRAPALVAATMVVMTGLAVVLSPTLPPDYGFGVGIDDSKLPVVAGRVLERDLRGARVLAPIQTSWYLMYASPSSRFLVDGRVPFYGVDHLHEVGRALSVPDQLEPLLVRYGVDTLVLEFSSSETQIALMNLTRIEGYYPISIEDDHVLYTAYVPGREALIESRAFRTLPPRLDPTPLLAPEAPVEAMRVEIERLDPEGHADAIRAWYEGVLAMRELSRGMDGGFRAPANDAERRLAETALADLSRAAPHYPLVPIVHAYRALSAVAACDPAAAKNAIAQAHSLGESRETLLAGVELALRTGDEAPARELLAAAEQDPRADADPWLAAVQQDLATGVRCH